MKPLFTPLQQYDTSLPTRVDLAVSSETAGTAGMPGAARLLAGAARSEGGFFVAPKVVDHDDS